VSRRADPRRPWSQRLRRWLSKSVVPVVVAAFAVLTSTAVADSASAPAYDGIMSFPAITGPASPEEYSWLVHLAPHQHLQLDADGDAEVAYEEGTTAFLISPEAAHAADGATVPTSLAVSGSDLITLTVHHRAGNPAAGGAPFDYPVTWGVGWETGYQTPVIIGGPPDETEIREERESVERREREAHEPSQPAVTTPPAATSAKAGYWADCGGVTSSAETSVIAHLVPCGKARRVISRLYHVSQESRPGSVIQIKSFDCVDRAGSRRPFICSHGPHVIRGPVPY
jgi:hypothetical protein